MINIKVINESNIFSNMYILESNGHIILIDPHITDSENVKGIIDFILLTHEHYDHISGVNFWREKTGAKVICSEACNEALKNPLKNFSIFFKDFCELQTMVAVDREVENCEYRCSSDITFENSFTFEWQGNYLKIFETPGHSKGSICVIVNDNVLFSGDSLFKDYPTMCKFPGGSKKQWCEKSIHLLKSLPGNIQVFPGHLESFYIKDYMFWNI